MDDLIAFLRSCLDREEQVAQRAAGQARPPWVNHVNSDPGGYTQGRIADAEGFTVIHVEDQTPEFATAEHIALHDPASVLADVAAKRRLIDEVYPQVVSLEDTIHGEFSAYPEVDVPLLLLKTLAQRYAGWPGWREEWRT